MNRIDYDHREEGFIAMKTGFFILALFAIALGETVGFGRNILASWPEYSWMSWTVPWAEVVGLVMSLGAIVAFGKLWIVGYAMAALGYEQWTHRPSR